jgi:hypothetical protein
MMIAYPGDHHATSSLLRFACLDYRPRGLRLRQCPDHRKQVHRASLPRTFYDPYAAYGEANATRRPPVLDRNGTIVKPFEPSTQTTRPGRIMKMLLGLQGPWQEATLPLPEGSEQSWERTLVYGPAPECARIHQ